MSSKTNFYFTTRALHKEVTGSCILCTIHFPNNQERNILIDCGIYQEAEYEELNRQFDFNVNNIDAVLITHSHADHMGRLPYIIKLGYNGPIYSSLITRNISDILLRDSAKAFYSEYTKEKKLSKNPTPPLYDLEDVEKVISLTKVIKVNEEFEIFDGVKVTFLDNGHLLGACSINIEATYKNRKPQSIFFGGDYKKENLFKEVLEIPNNILSKKNLNMVIESTLFENYIEPEKSFEKNIISELQNNKGILILSLAQERLATILYSLKNIESIGYDLDIWVDSPLGISILDVYKKNSIIDYMPKNINFVSSQKEREILYNSPQKKIIIVSSGMADGGNAPYYLESLLPRYDYSIFFTSYLSSSSLGRKVMDTPRGGKIRIFPFNPVIKKNAAVFQTREFSSHGSPDEILDFLNNFKSIANVFINHGSFESQKLLKNAIEEKGINAIILGTEEIHKVTNLGEVFSTSIAPKKELSKNDENRPSKCSNYKNRTIPQRLRKACINV